MGWQDDPVMVAAAGPATPSLPVPIWERDPAIPREPDGVRQFLRGNLSPKASAPEQVKDFSGALEAGLQVSVSGLLARGEAPSKQVSKDAPWYSRAASGVGSIAGDLPFMVGGALLGGAGGAPSGPGAAITAMGGAFALPAGLRATLMDAYTKGDIKSFGEFWDRASSIIWEETKGWLTGAATAVAGIGARAALPAAAPKLAQVAVPTTAELAAMVTVGAALEGHAPSLQDFMDAAIVLGGMKGAATVAVKLRQVYAATGRTPAQVALDAARDPEIKAELTGQIVPVRGAEPVAPNEPTVTAYHGSPHDFVKFDASKIGTGEGAQAYGHGLYFAESISVGRSYQTGLSGLKVGGEPFNMNDGRHIAAGYVHENGGDVAAALRAVDGRIAELERIKAHDDDLSPFRVARIALQRADLLPVEATGTLYRVEIPRSVVDDRMLDWDKPLSEQPERVRAVAEKLGIKSSGTAAQYSYSGERLYIEIQDSMVGANRAEKQAAASMFLRANGIPGIRYLDQGSRSKVDVNDLRSPTRNFVLFDDSLVNIVEKNGIPMAYRDLALQERGRQIVPGEKAEAVAAKPFADLLPQAVGEPTKPTHVNYNYITSAQDTKLALARISEVYEQEIQTQRRGSVSWAQTSAEAAKLLSDTLGGVDTRLLMPREPGTPAGAAEILARRQLTVGAAEDMMRARDELLAKGSSASMEDQLMFVAAVERTAMIGAEMLGARAEIGRAMNILKSTAIEADRVKQIQDVLAIYGKDPAKLAEMMRQIDNPAGAMKFAQEAVKATNWEKVVEAWKAAILSGPVTHVANVMGNTTFLALRAPVDAVAAALGAMRGGSDKVAMAEPLARIGGALQGSLDGMRLAWHVLKTGEQPGKSETFRKAIEGTKGEVIRISFRMLSAEDAIFSTMNTRGEAFALATRQAAVEGLNPLTREYRERVATIIDNPPPEMAKLIDEAGKRFTFNMELGEKGQAVQNFVRQWHLEWAVPFIRTPANIVKELGRMTPLAPLVKEWRNAIAKGGAERDKAIAEIAVGSAVTTTVFMFAMDGAITGAGDPDPAKRRIAQAAGWQPYSVKVGDTYYSYQRLQPAGTLMGLAADIAEVWDHMTDDESDKVPKMLAIAFGNAVTNQTFLQGITNIVNALSDPKRFGPRFFQNFAGSLVPNFIGQPAAMADPVVREVGSVLDAVRARIPGLRTTLLPKRDPFGQPIQAKERLGGLSPIVESVESTDKVRTEADRLNVGASAAAKKIHIGRGTGRFGNVELSPEERDRYSEASGTFAHALLTPIVNAPTWETLPDLAKRRIYEKAFIASHRVGALAALPPEKRLAVALEVVQKITDELQVNETQEGAR